MRILFESFLTGLSIVESMKLIPLQRPKRLVRKQHKGTKYLAIVNHTSQNHTPAPQTEKIAPITYTLVSDRVDWSRVSACVSSKKQCICDGHSVERLVIPDETCRLASKHSFPRSSKPTISIKILK